MTLAASNRNYLWANVLVDELARNQVRVAVIAPGSRSTPLAVAFAEHPAFTVHSLLDERGAAFFALGYALRSGLPAALVCTSGTAAANFWPAVVEAHQAQVPLLLLTADRPPELRGSGTNQTIDQLKLYGDFTRWFVELPTPTPQPAAGMLRYLRTLACRAVATACGHQGLPAGAVHLNLPFSKPLEPVAVLGDIPDAPTAAWQQVWEGRAAAQPWVRLAATQVQPLADEIAAAVQVLAQAERPLIVVGPRPLLAGQPPEALALALAAFAQPRAIPILAEALSDLRFNVSELPSAIDGFETVLQQQPDFAAPDCIVQVGAMPVGGGVLAWLNQQTCPRIALPNRLAWADETYQTALLLPGDPSAILRALAAAWPAPALAADHYYQLWQAASRRALAAIAACALEQPFEGLYLPALLAALPAHSNLFVASSLAVRHLEQFTVARRWPVRVFCNRGASGIDGTIASATGVAAADPQHLTVLVIGDLAFYHDLNALLLAIRLALPNLKIVLLNNDGGGLFRRLPIARHEPPFSALFLTQHGLQFAAAAQLFGWQFAQVQTLDDFKRVLPAVLAAHDQAHLIEVLSDSAAHEQMRRRIAAR
jgi:2-succinyl-5-enolpyruvyl-6-hydroxy-3-cyclohexene-1-carboxylate synthase